MPPTHRGLDFDTRFRLRAFTIGLSLLIAGSLAPNARATSASRVMGTVLFVAGIGAKTTGLVVEGDARSVYDDYLLTAVQEDIRSLRDLYRSKRDFGRALSNTGNGMMIAGALWTVYAALRVEPPTPLKVSLLPNRRPGEFVVAWRRSF